MYSCILFSVIVGLAISFCGQIESTPKGGQKTPGNEEPEKQPFIEDETIADARISPPKMVEEELEQKPGKETASSSGQGSKGKEIQGDMYSFVHTPKTEQTEIQEESTIDEKVKEKGLLLKQTEIQGEGQSDDEMKSELKRIISRSSTLSRGSSRKYTDDELNVWRDAFAVYDINKNGEISAEELEKTLRRLGEFDGSKEEIRRMIAAVDQDNSGTINFEEFIAMMSKRSDDELGELRRIFGGFDKNGDGYITADELKSLDLIDDDKMIDSLIAEVDINGDGKIDFIEFQTLLKRLPAQDV